MLTLVIILNKILLRTLLKISILIVSALLIVGCAGISPKANFYTLNSNVSNTKTTDSLKRSKLSLHIASVMIDETVDRPQLVIRTAQNQVEILEQQRWAQPLKYEISRVIAERLSKIIGTNKVTTYPLLAIKPDYILTIQVQNFESKLNESAQIRAYWTVRRTLDGMQTSDTSIITQAISSAGKSSYNALITAHSENLNHLSGDIANAINAMANY